MPIDRISHLAAPVPGHNSGQHRSFYRTFVQFLCSNLGLIIIVVAYCIGGAFLFILLEQYIELQNCQQGQLIENISISNLSETMYNYVAISSDNTTVIYDQIAEYTENFTSDIYERRNDYRYTGQDCLTTSGWSFPSALLFTITIVTSIGYGHITPTTWEGQITCICYALIGIPIFLLCLTNISSILGDIFRFTYSAFIRCFCCFCRSYTRNRRRTKRTGKSSDQPEVACVGITSTDPYWPEASRPHDDRLSDDGDDDDIDDESDDVWNEIENRVPTGVVILIIIGYICLGALMFNKFEDWTMLESIYFCYITLSTVGFGDYVPGITSSSTSGVRFVAASLYIIFGLAILAMCFDLLKESMLDKFRWFAYKFGIVGEDDDQIDEDRTGYANFEYTKQRVDSVKQSNENKNRNETYDPPPAYDHASTNEQWLKDIRDKVEPRRA